MATSTSRRKIPDFSVGNRRHSQVATKEIPIRHTEKNLHQESGSGLEQVAQRDYEISIFQDFKNSTGQVPEQPDLTLRLALL